MVFSSKSVVLCAYTMKTIPAIKTDRSAQKSGAEQGRHMQWCSTFSQECSAAGPAVAVFSEDCELDT
jgi:hypothetical protein